MEVHVIKILLILEKNTSLHFLNLLLPSYKDCRLSKHCDRCMVHKERWMLKLFLDLVSSLPEKLVHIPR